MTVRETSDALTATLRGSRFYFCSTGCRIEFTAPETEARRLWIHTTWAFATGAIIMLLMLLRPRPMEELNYLFLAMAAPIQFIPGFRFYRGFMHALRARTANMDTLIATGTTVAFAYSVLLTLAPHRYGHETFYDTSVLIIAFILLGKALEHAMKRRATTEVRALLDMAPSTATILRDGKEEVVRADELAVGQTIVLRPGQRVPADARVLEGRAQLNESMLTGESLPVTRGPGQDIIAGSVNLDGHVRAEVTGVGPDTTLAQIVRLVEAAQAGRAPVQRVADRVASIIVPLVILIAIGAFAYWWLVAQAGIEKGMLSAVAVLIIACPCAIGLATPAALLVGTSRGAASGILFKDGAGLEHASRVRTVLFDKTGTLTRGNHEVVEVAPSSQSARQEVLATAAAAEAGSEHPLARALVRAYDGTPQRAQSFKAVPGDGVMAVIEGRSALVGRRGFLEAQGVEGLDEWRASDDGRTRVGVALAGRFIGQVAFDDTIRPGAIEAVAALAEDGLDVRMVTGDSQGSAERVARTLSIGRVHAQVRPEEKAALVSQLRSQSPIAFVGDGINDAPALAAADVGVAIGSGTDVAAQTAGVVLIKSDPRDAVTALQLSRRTMRKIKQNLFWAFVYNLALVPVAATGVLDPIWAAAAMGLSSVTVVGNSLLLGRFRARRWTAPVETPRPRASRPQAAPKGLKPGIDPVCGMRADPETAQFVSEHEGVRIGFCSARCKDRFDADPQGLLQAGPKGMGPNTRLDLMRKP